MARRKKDAEEKAQPVTQTNAYIEGAGQVAHETIDETLRKNYMPYAMSVIVSRAFPEIDGFKPSHRKLLYTMYKMGLLNGSLTKSANIVGQTMRLNPHGDQTIYETMVRLARGNETLLHPYIKSKGNFGKAYSRDMAYAAPRYTEAKLEPICNELFKDIDKNAVPFVPNYDNTMQEPTLLPASFPSILVNANVGIGVSMASSICPFNLKEVCETTISLIKNPDFDVTQTLKGPDFPGGGMMLYDKDELEKIYSTGKGSIKLRAKYQFDKASKCLEITEIPATTTIEAIKEKILSLVKEGKIREISDIRDETDLNGLKIGIDLKKGTDPDILMQKLFKLTPLQDTYSCNFNILLHGYPKVLGAKDILLEWIEFRKECVENKSLYLMNKKIDRLHLLEGLNSILLDIDKAIAIIKETQQDSEVVPNLMKAFNIDEVQAEFVAEMKLRNLNKEHILKAISESEQLKKDIADLEEIIWNESRKSKEIIKELKEVADKYGQPRRTEFFYTDDSADVSTEPDIPDYPCTFFLTESGYFKKITPQSLRMSKEHKYKEGDSLAQEIEASNKTDILFFTDKAQVYKAKGNSFEDTKASMLGDYVPAKLGFDDGENVFKMFTTNDYSGWLMFFYENGKVAKIPLSSYETKQNRKKLNNAYCEKSKLIDIEFVSGQSEYMIKASNGRAVIVNTEQVLEKASRNSQGVQAITLKAKSTVEKIFAIFPEAESLYSKFKTKNIPAAGSFLRDMPDPDQVVLNVNSGAETSKVQS